VKEVYQKQSHIFPPYSHEYSIGASFDEIDESHHDEDEGKSIRWRISVTAS
jgi:hypothetical protein